RRPDRLPVNPEQRQLRIHRTLLLSGGAAYLGWWLFVHASLPNAFNPFGSRAVVVACFLAVLAASYAWSSVARNLDGWLAACCALATAHYFYLFDRNHADLNWVVGSYITVTAVCAILQTSRSLLLYSLFVALLSIAMLLRQPGVSYVVFLPGMLTNLLFANVGLHSRLRLLDRLRESHERIESLFDAGFDGIAVHEQGIVRQVNGALGPLLGYSKDELIGKEVASLFVPEARDVASEMVVGRREARHELDVLRKDGTRVTVEVMAKRHVRSGREMQQVAFRDLTERKRAEAALLRANRELESFSYSVAHDLRAPLRAIDGFSQVILEDYGHALDAEGKRHLERITAGAETMGRLIDALLDLARLTRKEVLRETVNLTEHAEAIVTQLQAVHTERDVDFVNQPGIFAQCDSQLLRVLLDNLIRNAWKFTERQPAPSIAFGCSVQNGVPVYYVRDNGAGFDMAHVGKLFGPFQRLHSAAEYPGTGIGLATVQRIVDRHGGRVWAEGAVNHGATFFFTLQAGPSTDRI
ncbi:MAG TPA: ATP-binding protein, partial [Labilithrix sp.]|nr:ATP-binding protein [Labilithrix sp.]